MTYNVYEEWQSLYRSIPDNPLNPPLLRETGGKSPLIKGARGLFLTAFAVYIKSCCHRQPNLIGVMQKWKKD